MDLNTHNNIIIKYNFNAFILIIIIFWNERNINKLIQNIISPFSFFSFLNVLIKIFILVYLSLNA